MTHDMTRVIEPKSDQINADDFMAGPKTFRIKGVSITPGSEQPVSIALEDSKPWKPCKSMNRLLVAAWGSDAKEYAGRSVTLYRDPKVKWGGMEVGGIRVSHLSHIERDMIVALTMTKGKRAPYTVKPLKAEPVPLKVVEKPAATDGFDLAEFEATVNLALTNFDDADTLATWWEEQKPYRLQARDADKARAGQIATRVNEQIEKLKGDC